MCCYKKEALGDKHKEVTRPVYKAPSFLPAVCAGLMPIPSTKDQKYCVTILLT